MASENWVRRGVNLLVFFVCLAGVSAQKNGQPHKRGSIRTKDGKRTNEIRTKPLISKFLHALLFPPPFPSRIRLKV